MCYSLYCDSRVLLRTLCGMANIKQSWYNTPFSLRLNISCLSVDVCSFYFLIFLQIWIVILINLGHFLFFILLKVFVTYGDTCNIDRWKVYIGKCHFISFFYLHIYCKPGTCGFKISCSFSISWYGTVSPVTVDPFMFLLYNVFWLIP